MGHWTLDCRGKVRCLWWFGARIDGALAVGTSSNGEDLDEIRVEPVSFRASESGEGLRARV